jgi:dTDP-4-amino-4,6-dideoxygalactose transaminase
MHQQEPYAHFPRGAGGLPVTEALAGTVLALPMHSYLDEATQDRIIAAVRGYNG